MILNVHVEKIDNSVSACIEEVNGFLIAVSSVKELHQKITAALQFHADGFINPDPNTIKWLSADNHTDEWLSDQNWEFNYHYDIRSFLDLYQEIFNQNNFARVAGINNSLMRQYVSGIKDPSKKQISRIQNNLRTFAANLAEFHVN
jgi:hypothetical protein